MAAQMGATIGIEIPTVVTDHLETAAMIDRLETAATTDVTTAETTAEKVVETMIDEDLVHMMVDDPVTMMIVAKDGATDGMTTALIELEEIAADVLVALVDALAAQVAAHVLEAAQRLTQRNRD